MKKITFIGLLFLFIETKELCEARAFETARAQSELFTFQCSQWELIWNSQLIGRYKEMSVWHQVNLTIYPPIWNCQSSEWTLHFSMWSMRAHLKQSTKRALWSKSIWNCQSSEWTLHFSMQSMRAHLKQSTNRKISGNVSVTPGKSYDIPPTTTLPQQLQFTFLRFSALPGNSANWPPWYHTVAMWVHCLC